MPIEDKPIEFAFSKNLLALLFLVIATVALYWQIQHFEFIAFDDEVYVSKNTKIQGGITTANLEWATTTFYAANWHPLTWLSHLLDAELYGMDAGAHHGTNLLLHAINALLLFLFLKQATGRIWESLWVAALFAIHPLHVESVAQVAERKDLLCAFFWIAAMWSYAGYSLNGDRKRYWLSLLLFIMSLLSKPMVVTLPLLLLVMDYWPLCRFENYSNAVSTDVDAASSRAVVNKTYRIIKIFVEKIPFLALSAGMSVVTIFAQKEGGAIRSIRSFPMDMRLSNAVVSYVDYMWKMIWPHDLAFFYPAVKPTYWKALISIGIIAAITLYAYRQAAKKPYFIAGWLWYVGTLFPVIGIVQVGGQAMADRYTYIPLIGLFLIIAWECSSLASRRPHWKKAILMAALVVCTAFMFRTWVQVRYWSDSISLFGRAIEVTEDNVVAHTNIGNVYHRRGDFKQAADHFSEAIKIKPDYAEGYNNLGMVLDEMGNEQEAVFYLRKAISLSPGLEKAHNNLGNILTRTGQYQKAIEHFRKALQIKPDFIEVYHNMAVACLYMGDVNKAIQLARRVIEEKPRYAVAYNTLGVALHRIGHDDGAITFFKMALELNPALSEARDNLENVMAALHSQTP